jgi:hypothetical protein
MKVAPLKADNEFWSLTPGKEYVVIGLDHESYRIVDDKGEPILFPKEGFKILDATIPEDWVWKKFSADEYYADPPELGRTGFYEDYFDGNAETAEQLRDYLRRAKGKEKPASGVA